MSRKVKVEIEVDNDGSIMFTQLEAPMGRREVAFTYGSYLVLRKIDSNAHVRWTAHRKPRDLLDCLRWLVTGEEAVKEPEKR